MKRILVIIPFESVYPPMNGGSLRAVNLLVQLAKYFEVTVIINQDRKSFLKGAEEFPVLRKCTVIGMTPQERVNDLFSLLPVKYRDALRYRYWSRSFKGPAETFYLLIYPLLKKCLRRSGFDYVILEDMSILNIAKVIKRSQPDARIIYDAYNVNSRLAETAFIKGEVSKKVYDWVKTSEAEIFKRVSRIFACSENDLLQLKEMNGGRLEGIVIPNGVNVPVNNRVAQKISVNTDDMLFCGSLDYLPNQEGLVWFCNEIFPLILRQKPTARLMVVGKGEPGNELRGLLASDGIIYYGMVESVGDYYRNAAVALVPLLSGSGTRLKLLEAMGYGVPIVSTSIGAEGIDYTDGVNIRIADERLSFADAVVDLLNEKNNAMDMAANALSFVRQRYDWNVVGEKLSAYLNDHE